MSNLAGQQNADAGVRAGSRDFDVPGAAPQTTLRDVQEFLTPPRIIKIAILAVLFYWLFHGTINRLVLVWLNDAIGDGPGNWSHGLVIPFFCIGILYFIRDRWLDVPLRPTWWGFAVIGLAMLLYVWATWWAKLIMAQDYSWWFLMVGIVLALCGWRFVARVWFPLVFLLFAIRIGGTLYNPISTKMQQIAALCASFTLKMFGIDAELHGVVIDVITRSFQTVPLQVAEACSGMKILMAFMALGALMAYMARRPWWHRLTLLLATVPIAIISNVFRVAGMGVLHYFDKGEWARGFAHTLEGMLMLPIAFLLFWLLHWILSKLVVEEHDEDAEHQPRAPQRVHVRPGPSDEDRSLSNLREPHFLAVAGFLLVAAASWNIVSAALDAVFIKYPVPLKQALDRFPHEIASADGGKWVMDDNWERSGSWTQINHMPKPEVVLDSDTEKTLGARHPTRYREGEKGPDQAPSDPESMMLKPQYIQRTYHKVDRVGKEIDGSAVLFFVSYYTGEPDVVPHVPERCYLGGGFTENLKVGGYPEMQFPGIEEPVSVRRVQFRKAASDFGMTGERISNVIYFFAFNGQFSGHHETVRLKLNSPFGKHAYYAKVEVQFPLITDPDEHEQRVRDLLQDFVPVLLEGFFPDWSKWGN